MKTLNEIRKEVESLAAKINATGSYALPTYAQTKDGAIPHIEVNKLGYHYVVVERGHENKRISTNDLDELLYQVFQSVTFDLACKYELNHRIERQDPRRILFKHQAELLSTLSEKWGVRRGKEHEKILEKFPWDDLAGVRDPTPMIRAIPH